MRAERVNDEQWASRWVEGLMGHLPRKWQGRLVSRWALARKQNGGTWAVQKQADAEVRATVEQLGTTRVPLNATDEEICGRADKLAAMAFGKGQLYGASFAMGIERVREAMEGVCKANNVEPPSGKKMTDAGAIGRMSDPLWWRKKLRRAHAKALEGAAIRLGYVNAAQQCYVSDDSQQRHGQMKRAAAVMLENTIATNEDGQEFTMAELVAASTANKLIRRAELMTRIAGFERLALDMGHVGLFMTMTAPGRMHRFVKAKKGKRDHTTKAVFLNPKFDGTMPDDAQDRHAAVWARIRAQCARRGIRFYGFRIAEPNHDGTPHWHLLLFLDPAMPGDCQRAAIPRFYAIVRRYSLGKGERNAQRLAIMKTPVFSPLRFAYMRKEYRQAVVAKLVHTFDVAERARQNTQRAEKKHGVDFKPILAGKGSAAGYIAKYVAKNIDGYGLEKDMFGNDAVTTSARVEAWASTHGIRQFQQIGGPPVGVWRELRRVKGLPDDAPAHLVEAWEAVNKVQTLPGRESASVAWDKYTRAQGGVFCGRKSRIKVATRHNDTLGRYGEPLGARPIGVVTESDEFWTPANMAHMGGRSLRRVVWVVESARHVWTIKKRGTAAPWTCVNNCTEDEKNGRKNSVADASGDGASVERSHRSLEQGPDEHSGDGRLVRERAFGGDFLPEQRSRPTESPDQWQLS